MRSFSTIASALLLAAVVLSGCAPSAGTGNTYVEPSGEGLAKLDIHTTESWTGLSTTFAQVIRLDGKDIPIWNVSFGKHTFNISPGEHQAVVWYRDASIAGRKDLTTTVSFAAQPGKSYVVRAAAEGQKIYVWLEDDADKSVVARSEITLSN